MSAIRKAIDLVGGPSAFAKKLHVTTQAACFWRDGRRRVPVEKMAAIERLTNGQVTRRELLPESWHEVWPELKQGASTEGCAQGEHDLLPSHQQSQVSSVAPEANPQHEVAHSGGNSSSVYS